MKRFMKDKRGSSLVMVLITMTFLSILGVTVITMTINNIRLKSAQKFNESNYYDSESVVDMITTGLKDTSSKLSADAYEEALSGYNKVVDGSNEAGSISDQYKDEYLMKVAYKVASDGAISGKSESKFRSSHFELKTDAATGLNKWNTTASFTYSDDVIKKYIRTDKQDYYIDHSSDNAVEVNMDKGYLVLKNIKVRHKSEKDFETYIKTDVKIKVPDSDISAKSEYLAYALIADDQVMVGSDPSDPDLGASKNVTIKGDVYAGTSGRKAASGIVAVADSKDGIIVEDGSDVSMVLDQLITRGDIVVRGGSKLNVEASSASESNIWCENITTEKTNASKGGNELNIKGNSMETYVADDLTVNGNGDKVTLNGKYYGYTFADVNKLKDAIVSSSPTNRYDLSKAAGNTAEYNSSIAINGTGVNFDMTHLSELLIAGTSYIDKNLNAGESIESKNGDIRLQESLSPKGNQIAYFIPGRYITDSIGDGSADDYKKFTDGNNNEKYFNITKYSDEYLGFKADDYYETVKAYYRHDTLVAEQGVEYYYFIVDGEKDNKKPDNKRFFNLFMNSDKHNQNVKTLNGKFGVVTKGENTLISSTGNIYTVEEGGDVDIKGGILDPSVSESTLNQFIKTYNHEYMSRQMSLLPDYGKTSEIEAGGQLRLVDDSEVDNSGAVVSDSDLTPTKSGTTSKTNLFDVLIDRSELEDMSVPKEIDVASESGGSIKGIYITKTGDYTIDTNDLNSYKDSNGVVHGIVVATGNVTIKTSFSGLVIAGGDIRVNGSNVNLYADSDTVSTIISKEKYLDDVFSEYYRKSVAASIKNGNDGDDSLVQTINWQLNGED